MCVFTYVRMYIHTYIHVDIVMLNLLLLQMLIIVTWLSAVLEIDIVEDLLQENMTVLKTEPQFSNVYIYYIYTY